MNKIVILFMAIMISSVAESDIPKTSSSNFDSYVNGALDVYSQFKTPSKEESEKFYNFINAKWTATKCISECKRYGYTAAQEYVNMRNIQIDNKELQTQTKERTQK